MAGPRAREISLFDRTILSRAAMDSVGKFAPQVLARNPVMFVVEVGSVFTSLLWLRDWLAPAPGAPPLWFTGLVTMWLWFTVSFANFAESVAEGRGKAQADTLRKTRSETVAHVRRADGTVAEVPSTQLQIGDLCMVAPGELIPGDGDVVEGIASV